MGLGCSGESCSLYLFKLSWFDFFFYVLGGGRRWPCGGAAWWRARAGRPGLSAAPGARSLCPGPRGYAPRASGKNLPFPQQPGPT